MDESSNYQKQLLYIKNNQDNQSKELSSMLKFNVYLSLLSLNNHNYSNTIFIKEHDIIDDFLRRVNNLKVKIQLKRKEKEIDTLLEEIIKIYNNNEFVIEKYNKNSIDVIKIISSREPKKITLLIDAFTKVKMKKCDKKDEYSKERKYIDKNIFNSKYYLQGNKLYLIVNDENYNIDLEEFYNVFDYLLDINNYQQIFLNNKINRSHILTIAELIKLAQSHEILKDIEDKQLIPILLTSLINTKINNLNEIDTSSFKISNIKIADLYSFASHKEETNIEKAAKWNKIIIPNQYLYDKLKELVKKGMYYYQEGDFTLENIDNKISDFKVSISIPKAIELLQEIINNHIESFQVNT